MICLNHLKLQYRKMFILSLSLLSLFLPLPHPVLVKDACIFQRIRIYVSVSPFVYFSPFALSLLPFSLFLCLSVTFSFLMFSEMSDNELLIILFSSPIPLSKQPN